MKIPLTKHREQGLTLIEVLVVIGIFAILAIMVYPGGGHDKARSWRIQCLNNLKQTGLAFRVWSEDNGGKYPMEISETNGGTMEFTTGANVFRHFQVMSNELSMPKVLICPADDDAWFRPATNFVFLNNSNISFFINLNVAKTNPQSIWSGDHNITNGTPIRNSILELTADKPAGFTPKIHNKCGNLLLADGSVQQVSTPTLRQAVKNSGAITNRLQMPVLSP